MPSTIEDQGIGNLFNYFATRLLLPQYEPHSIFKGILLVRGEEISLINIITFFSAEVALCPSFAQQPIYRQFEKIHSTIGPLFSIHLLEREIRSILPLINYIEKSLTGLMSILKTPFDVFACVKLYLETCFPGVIREVILTGSACLKKESCFSDIDIVVILKDEASRRHFEVEAARLKNIAFGSLDIIVITEKVFWGLHPIYKYAALLNLLEFNLFGQSRHFSSEFNDSLYFLADFKIRVQYLAKDCRYIPRRKLIKNVYYLNALQSTAPKEKMMSLDYESFPEGSVLGQELIKCNYEFNGRFAQGFRDALIELHPKAMMHLQEFPEVELDMEFVDPFFLEEMRLSTAKWRVAYRNSIDKVLFGRVVEG